MQSIIETPPLSKKRLWAAGRIITSLIVLLLLLDASGKLMRLAPVIEGTVQLGYPESAVFSIGLIQFICIVIYVIPRTSILGAILLTGYLGGAVATHVRIGNPLFTHALFPVYLGVLVWAGLFLLDVRLRTFFVSRSQGSAR
ncbi:MAG: DoxX family protein [Ignavibacteriales bacterium]|nr:DoxX family protein [Ignavibacteriales bacterium]